MEHVYAAPAEGMQRWPCPLGRAGQYACKTVPGMEECYLRNAENRYIMLAGWEVLAMGAADRMTTGPIWKQILIFSIPLILGNLLQQLYNTVDSIVVGRFLGSNALAAVGSGSQLIFFIISFSMGASIGAGVLVAQTFGAEDRDGIHRTVHNAVALGLMAGIVITIAGVLLASPLLRLLGTPDEVFRQAEGYLRVYFSGSIFTVFYNFATGILNAVGKPNKSLQYLAISAITNTVLDVLLVAVFHMGVEGAALATVISQAAACVFITRYLLTTEDEYRVTVRDIRPERQIIGRMLYIGLPTGLQNTLMSLSNVVIQSAVNSFGPTLMAANAAYSKLDGFNILPVVSFSNAITTFAGQNIGANKPERVKTGLYVTLAMGVGYVIVTGSLIFIFGRPLMRIFVNDDAVIDLGLYIMRFFCPFFALNTIMHITCGAVRGTGKTVPPMLIMLFFLCVFRIVWVNVTLRMFGGMFWVFSSYPISWVLTDLALMLYVRHSDWLGKAPQRAS